MTSPRSIVTEFLDSTPRHPLLGIVYGRRRIGKSTLLFDLARRRGGFYFEATRTSSTVQLERLGRALGEHLGVGRIALDSWDEAVGALLRLGTSGAVPVVLDEFGYLLDAEPAISSLIANGLGPSRRNETSGSARLILCGSAISVMSSLTAGQAPLRGRAGMELVMYPDDFRVAAGRLPGQVGLPTAANTYAVIGGVVGYATDMVNFDLPANSKDFDRWVVQRVLSPGATLHHEASTLLAEDPTLGGAGATLHHSILGAIANGSVTAGAISTRVGRPVSNLAPSLNRLVDSGFVVRHEDPLRDRRPLYALADPYLQFHYAVLEPHRALLRDRSPEQVWADRLRPVFDSQVRGPAFEEQARTWVRRFAAPTTIPVGLVGPSSAVVDGVERELDIVVAEPGDVASQRTVLTIGEAKAGETLGLDQLERLERVRASLGVRAAHAKLLLAGPAMSKALISGAERRDDVELVDLDRLYHGS